MANKLYSFALKLKNNLSKMLNKVIKINDLLHNKILLYSVFIFSLLNLFVLANTGDYTYIAVFILIGFITTFFSKNMLVVLLLSLILTNVLKYGSTLNEGFEEGVDEEDENKEGLEDEKEGLEDEKEGLAENTKKEETEEDEKEKKEDEKDKKTDEKESLKDLKNSANELLTNISSLNSTIQKFSNFDFAK
jgi:hypothetical protein